MPDTQLFTIAEIDVDLDTVAAVGDPFIRAVLEAKRAEALVLIDKQRAYGPHNIGRPPHGVTPEVALIVRINDKVQRLSTLLAAGDSQPPGSEARLDSWGDLANYGTIGTLVEQGLWPGLESHPDIIGAAEHVWSEPPPDPEGEGHPGFDGEGYPRAKDAKDVWDNRLMPGTYEWWRLEPRGERQPRPPQPSLPRY